MKACRITGLQTLFTGLLAIVLLSSCSSVLQFQDAAPLGKGVVQVMGGFGAGYYPEEIESRKYGFPFTAALRYGIGDRSDLGIRYSLDDDVELNFKHNLVHSRIFLFSAGVYAGVDDVFSSHKIPYAGIPAYIQFRFGDAFSIYGVPSVSFGRFESDIGLNANIGVSFGRWDKFYIEAGLADYNNIGSSVKTFGVGFAHRL